MKITLRTVDLKQIYKSLKAATSKVTSNAIRLKCFNGECVATSMDAYRIHTLTVHCEGDDGEMLIPIVKIPNNKISNVTISEEGEEIIFDFTTEKVTNSIVVCDFPNTEQFFSKDEPCFEIALDSTFLAEACESFDKNTHLLLTFYGDMKPCVITPDKPNNSDKRLIMPVRRENGMVKQ